MNFLTKIFGTRNDKILKQIQPLVNRINELEPLLQKLSDADLAYKSVLYRERLARGESVDALLPEAYATCREASRRVLGQRHYDVQLIGGIVLNQGKISEMKTGEGKTLTATLPCYLRGLTGKGAHLVTVNDYLARRDAQWMSQVYGFLGLKTGVIVHGLSDAQRRESYAADITYGTNNEFGFDYLRDNMKTSSDRLVQRGHHFAIVDEVDSILIDEARTPLIISGPAETNTELYRIVNTAIPGIQKDSDYVVDEKSRSISLTEDGIAKLEKRLKVQNLYDPSNIEWLHHIQQALKAHFVFKKDVDYVVRDGDVLIVDEFTGRLMPGRRYSDGLHGALEAKEHVEVQQETQTMATITFQNYFRLYDVLSGMTGTADTEAVEFHKIYGLDVVAIPPNRKITRIDDEDVIYRTAREKFNAIADDIAEAQKKGQPILVGTVSVEKSELLSSLLKKRHIPHEVLNAKNHAREATIIAEAGQRGRVTIATNMAGRGTDIVLGPGVKEVGGLYVIGTERHESRRIDNQLRGRSGRQGDPGKSKFFLSLEDDLMRIFASDRLSAIMERLGMTEGESIISPMVTRAIEKAQKRVEEQNFSSRKNLLEYDDVMSQQRQVIYKRRYEALINQSELDFFAPAVEAVAENIVKKYSPEALDQEHWDLKKASAELSQAFYMPIDLGGITHEDATLDRLVVSVSDTVKAHYDKKLEPIGPENKKRFECYFLLQIIDKAWKEHLQSMDVLKDSVSLRGYGQRDPLQEYKKEAFQLFASLMHRVEEEATMALVRVPPPEPQPMEHGGGAELATIDEDDFEMEPEFLAEAKERNRLQPDKEDGLIYHSGHQETAAAQNKPAAPVEALPVRREADKVGRNDPCTCGSGRKYKKCHGLSSNTPDQPGSV